MCGVALCLCCCCKCLYIAVLLVRRQFKDTKNNISTRGDDEAAGVYEWTKDVGVGVGVGVSITKIPW